MGRVLPRSYKVGVNPQYHKNKVFFISEYLIGSSYLLDSAFPIIIPFVDTKNIAHVFFGNRPRLS